VGTTAMAISVGFALMIGYYLMYTARRIGTPLVCVKLFGHVQGRTERSGFGESDAPTFQSGGERGSAR
ncbi:hypothetical protein ABZ260_33550, partial [Streptosporangium sp. NPDC006013]